MKLPKTDVHYQAIKKWYGKIVAERSNVPYIQHIDEGLKIGRILDLSLESMEGYCLHPIFQSDADLRELRAGITPRAYKVSAIIFNDIPYDSVVLAMEYRRVANSYLSRDKLEDLVTTPIPEVWEMLKMDKIQNRKDFELHHKGTHPRSEELDNYFKNWMGVLGISEEQYQDIVEKLTVK